MADDTSYTAFLNKANQDVNNTESRSSAKENSASTSEARGKFDPTTSSSSGGIPKPLSEINATYVSDTDSNFEPVFFSYASDDLPSIKEFQQCLGAKGKSAKVSEMSPQDFDPIGLYSDTIDKVRQSGNGQGVKVFRLEVDSTRVEYYIITVGERKLLGVMAKAVES